MLINLYPNVIVAWMKSILLPTDFSKNSINAIEYAVNLFKDEPVEFFVLNIQKASTFVSDDLMSIATRAGDAQNGSH